MFVVVVVVVFIVGVVCYLNDIRNMEGSDGLMKGT